MRFLVEVNFTGKCKVVVEAKDQAEASGIAEDIVVRNYLDFSPEADSEGKVLKEYVADEDNDRWLLSLSQ